MLKRILATTAIALAVGFPAWAQNEAGNQRAQDQQARSQQAPEERPMNQVGLAKADIITGASVRNPQGEDIGQVERLVVDVKKGQLSYAIVGVGGFLGVGQKSVAVPWNRLQPGTEPQSFVLSVDRQTLEQAPSVGIDNLAQLEDPGQQQQISSFWEQAANQQAQTPSQPPRQAQ